MKYRYASSHNFAYRILMQSYMASLVAQPVKNLPAIQET